MCIRDRSNAVAETIQNNKDKTINSASELTDHLPSNVETTENAQPDTFVKIKEVSGGALNKDVKYTLKRNMLKKLRKVNLTLLTYDNTVLAEKDMSTKDDQIKEKSLFDNLYGGENIKFFDNNDVTKQASDENDISKLNFSFISIDALKSQDVKIMKRKNEVNIVFPPVIATPVNKMKYFVKIDGGPIYNLNLSLIHISEPTRPY